MSTTYPSSRPVRPIMRPVFTIYFCFMNPVASARAFGGVEIGRTIATDEQMATPMRRVDTPPKAASWSDIEVPAIARIGTNRAAVAVWLMKLAMR